MISIEKIALPVAELGAADPLPDIKNNTYIHASINTTDRVKKDELPNLNRGMIPTMLPYLTQNGYTRDRHVREVEIAVLENEYLRAEFFPEFGGRLRRLYDKEHDRELLYVNPVFQPCNLALRNAWFSGGVEFNVGIKGHNPLTCSPVFAEKRVNAQGEEYLSLYEYERIRGVVFSVNAYLPNGAKSLRLRCCIENTEDKEKYMYWWSNIAVDEKKDTRVIVPTDETYINYFGNDSYVLDSASLPFALDTDISYPQNAPRSLDYFYKIPDESPKWIVAVDGEGKGLLHTSTPELIGRKLFVWGVSKGGKHWAEYLSREGNPSYIEIQAGLARTQLEHFLMAPNSRLEWVEAYSSIDIGDLAHGDWHQARDAVAVQIAGADALYAPALTPTAELASHELLCQGSGWGSLEAKLTGRPISAYFDEWQSASSDAAYFAPLLAEGTLPTLSPLTPPTGYVMGKAWEQKLRLTAEKAPSYAVYLHLGVNRYHAYCRGEATAEECIALWEQSYEAEANPWALRNLGAFYSKEMQDYEKGVHYLEKALAMHPSCRPLAVECGQMLFAAARNGVITLQDACERWLGLCDTLQGEAKAHGRVSMLKAKALIDLDRLNEAEAIVNEHFELADIKEGEISISELWFELQAKKAGITLEEAKKTMDLPYALDFRMH